MLCKENLIFMYIIIFFRGMLFCKVFKKLFELVCIFFLLDIVYFVMIVIVILIVIKEFVDDL